jgi:hypothetical protein
MVVLMIDVGGLLRVGGKFSVCAPGGRLAAGGRIGGQHGVEQIRDGGGTGGGGRRRVGHSRGFAVGGQLRASSGSASDGAGCGQLRD